MENLTENKKLNTIVIQEKLQQKGFTQADLAEKVGVSKESVSQWLKGTKFPRPLKLLKMAQVLKMTFSEMINKIAPINEPIVAFRVKAHRKATEEYIENAKYMGRLLEEIVPFLPFDKYSRPPSLIDPKLNYEYIHKITADIRKQIGAETNPIINFGNLISFFYDLHAVIIPVFWGDKHNHENALHIYTPASMTTWIYLNLDSKIHDFKFWMAHELGHVKAPTLIGEEGEDFADAFASSLLIDISTAQEIVMHLNSLPNKSTQITYILDEAKRLAVSPITVYLEAKQFAEKNDQTIVDLTSNQEIYKATTNFAKNTKTIAQILLNNKEPSAAEYLSIPETYFKSPIFTAMRQYLKAQGKSAGYVQNVLNISIGDAQYLYEELC